MQNYTQTIISQYANSPVIDSVIGSFNAAEDPSGNIDNWYNLVWNVATAQGYGLDVWGRIVGVSRVIYLASGDYFGFSGPNGGSGDSFDQAPFYSGAATTSNYSLTDDAYRQLIYAKAYFNISNGSVPSINNILMSLFGQPAEIGGGIGNGSGGAGTLLLAVVNSGNICPGMVLAGPGIASGTTIVSQTSGQPGGTGVYVVSISQNVPLGTSMTAQGTAHCTDGHDMTMTYTFSFVPTPVQLSIIQNSGVLPRPCGVSVTTVHP